VPSLGVRTHESEIFGEQEALVHSLPSCGATNVASLDPSILLSPKNREVLVTAKSDTEIGAVGNKSTNYYRLDLIARYPVYLDV
jgi:hypothetical protein